MTLNTSVVVFDPINPRTVFEFGRALLGNPDSLFEEKPGSICNRPNQGLSAWLFVHYGEDGPLTDKAKHDAEQVEYGDDPADYPYPHEHPVLVEVSFDTTYGAKWDDRPERGCSDYHAWLVFAFGAFFEHQGVRWSWQNEFTGEWHKGLASVIDLGDPRIGMIPVDTSAFFPGLDLAELEEAS